MLAPWKERYDKSRQCIRQQSYRFANKGLYRESYEVSSGHVWMWELDCKEGWSQKNWCFWTVVLEKTLERPLGYTEITSVKPKGKQPEYSLEGLKLKLKGQYFGHLLRRTDSLEKSLMLGKIEGRRIREQQRMRWCMASLTQWTWVWASSRRRWRTGKPGVLQSIGCKELDMTEQLYTHTHTHMCLVAQSCPALWDPMDCSPPGSSVHEDYPGKNTDVGGHAPLQYTQTHIYQYR